MTSDTTRTIQPRAVIAVFDETSNTPTGLAKCECGWNAAVCATDSIKAQEELHVLMEAHRRTCPRRVLES